MTTVLVDVTDAWRKAQAGIRGLRFRSFEDGIRADLRKVTVEDLPDGVTVAVEPLQSGRFYMYVEVKETT